MDTIISSCAKYRYTLVRQWQPGNHCLSWILLNPSEADATLDDPTIRRCKAFAQRWGYDGIHVANLFAWRDKDRSQLRKVSDPVGPENDRYILDVARSSDKVILGWGESGRLLGRSEAVIKLLFDAGITPYALAVNKSKAPRHPLYISADSVPFHYAR